MDERFLESIVHKRAPFLARLRGYSGHVVLGRRLRPFSLWHQELLQGIDSPFLSVWEENPLAIQVFNALYLAIQICRLRPFQSPVGGGDSRIRWVSAFQRKSLVFRFYVLPGSRNPRKRLLKLLIEAAKFRAYMSDYCSGAIPFPVRNSKRVQSPVSAYQVELYRRFHPGLSARQVWALSPAEISWANVASQEAAGNEVSLMTKERQQAREQAMRGKRKAKPKPGGNGKRF